MAKYVAREWTLIAMMFQALTVTPVIALDEQPPVVDRALVFLQAGHDLFGDRYKPIYKRAIHRLNNVEQRDELPELVLNARVVLGHDRLRDDPRVSITILTDEPTVAVDGVVIALRPNRVWLVNGDFRIKLIAEPTPGVFMVQAVWELAEDQPPAGALFIAVAVVDDQVLVDRYVEIRE